MESNQGKGAMDPQKNHDQVRYSNVETRNEAVGSSNQRFFYDPSSNINTNIRPPDYNMSIGARPVLNYSIQTGEEFALEFMRERVNPRQHFILSAYVDPNTGPAYMDLKGMLGVSHTGSESGSDISMVNAAERGRAQEFERKAPAHESMRSVPRSSSRNDISQGHQGHASSGTAFSSSSTVKFLCSFGGKILPRPGDGKLRYVGGETRIIRLSRDISLQELVHKTLEIYSQAHAIKYQLPGEDLDALVSVSSDEDLQNMMEECSVPDNGGSQKPRMFLFSSSDLEDAQYSLSNVEGDSEFQYVVAVNGMDLGSQRNSVNLASSSEKNLDDLFSLNVEREADRAAAEPADAISVAMSVNRPPPTIQSTQPLLPNSSNAYESSLQPHIEPRVQYGEAGQQLSSTPQVDGKSSTPVSAPLQYGYGSHPSNYMTPGETLVSMPLHGHFTPQAGLVDEKVYGGFQVQDPEVTVKEVKLKRDSSAPKINEPEKVRCVDKPSPAKEPKMKRDISMPKINETDKIRMPENEYVVSREEALVSNSVPDINSTLSGKSFKKPQEPLQNSAISEVKNEGRKNNEDGQFYTANRAFISGGSGSQADPTGSSYLEPSMVPQPVFHSERIPREQAEMNRLSKSDDSFGSQFLMTQGRSDGSQSITESVDKVHESNVASQVEQSIAPAKPIATNSQTVTDGLLQFEKCNDFAEKTNKVNTVLEEGLESKLKSELNQVPVNSMSSHEKGRVKENHTDSADKEAAGLTPPTANEGASIKNQGNEQPLPWSENPVRAVSKEEAAVAVRTPEQGDIIIDINDRFPPDILSEISLQARMSQNISSINLQVQICDGAGLSVNMENHEPKRWSYFRNLDQDEFARKDVSLMDQDHLGFSSPLTNIKDGAPLDYSYPPLNTGGVAFVHGNSHINFDEDIRQESTGVTVANTMDLSPDYSQSQLKGDENAQLDRVTSKVLESDYGDGKLDIQNTGSPLLDLSLADFDISTLQIIMNEDLEELRELGSGTFGTVYHGKWRGTDVAIKRIKKSCFTGRSSEQERLTLEFWREAEILSKLHHPNVVAFYGVVQDGPGGTLATVTEFMVNGSLRSVLLSKDRHLDRRKRLIIAMDAAFGMEYLHSKNIVHFDLKCDNLLVNLKDPVRPICKVGDFGLSKIKRNTLVTGGVRGTLPWMAPELLNGSSSKVSEKVDVFSFGIVLWEILTGEEPYANMHYGAIIGGIVHNTLRPPVPSFCDPEWRLLMEQCWAPDPVARPSFTEITRRLRVMSAASQTKSHGHQPQHQVPK
ncbi:hypothetical protein SLEP1_g34229 [Rubroshorea leprosula]|uniref:Protein kinase domain-containing protein n=1 Tax=Rubroshorea leprosula TaxID=152421 RepID=A0AAV5KJD8_9ROSI|nr:hypothetical protein SLEP1_g34229 [Rubroshorea leprosula]